MSKDKEPETRQNSREEALERLLEATLETSSGGTPDIAEAVTMAEASGVMLHEVDAPIRKPRLSFANVASAAGLIIALAALGFVLFGSHFMGDDEKPENPRVAEQEKESPKEDGEVKEDRAADFAPLGYEEALGYDIKEWPTAKSAAELKKIVESENPTSTLVLQGSQITAQVLKDAVAGLPKLESLALIFTPLENEDMDALLGFKEMRHLMISSSNVSDPFLMQAWLLKLFPDEVGGMVSEKIAERKAWCQQLVSYSTNVEFPMEAGSEQDPFVRLGAKFFDNYFKNLQMLAIPVRTFQRFLRDKPSENVGGLTDLLPNLKHLSLSGKGISDDEMQGLATSIRRRSFIAGDDLGLAARLRLESFTIDLRWPQEDKDFTSRGLGYIRDGKIFVCEELLSLSIYGVLKNYHNRAFGSLYPANFEVLEELRIVETKELYADSVKAWLVGLAAQAKPAALKRLVLAGAPIGNEAAREILNHRELLTNLQYLDLRNAGINLPLFKRLVREFAPCEVPTWEDFDSKKNFIRVMPYNVVKQNGREVIDDAVYYADCYLYNVESDFSMFFEARQDVRGRVEVDEYLPNTTFPLPFGEDSSPAVYDSLEIAAGEYEVVVIARGYEISRTKLSYDGKGRKDLLVELKVFAYENRRPLAVKDTQLRFSIAGTESEYRKCEAYLVQGDRVLEGNLPLSQFDDYAESQSDEPGGYFDNVATNPIEVLILVAGLPTLRIPFAQPRHFRKHAIWDGEKWSLKDIPLFK